uniref:Putative acetyltransferase n=1 Tax=Xenopsylla cheopis TaxID=163159 RepID=A0A6M2DS14_XENCH
MPSSNPLPPKENALFKRILRCYEHKQYKNGLKFAKQILSNPKYTEHGETLAMKGLTLNCLGRKEEAYEHVRRGLRNDLKSHVCWHVYGLLQRTDKKYDEAIKCYRNALKWEKDNLEILRDLSLLQIQMRDMEGYKDTRYQLFLLRPTQRASWIGFAMSYHLLGDYEMANSILETFRRSQLVNPNNKNTIVDYEHSELLLYQNQVIAEAGRCEDAIKHLEMFSEQIMDKLAVKETSGEYMLKLGRYPEAIRIYEGLVHRNPENTLYYNKLIVSKQLPEDEIVNFYIDYQKLYPTAIAPRRLALNHATGNLFRQLVDDYLKKGLRKGIPPLFVDLRSVYSDSSKVEIIQKLLLEYVECLMSSGYFSKDDNQGQAPASALLWTYYFLAQHYDHLKDTAKALEYIDAAIEHTPTLIELFVTKGKIFKHAGDPYEAYKWVEEAQALDTADRYINSKCAKYMLRVNMVREAEHTCAKFTREGVSAMENLNEMQCMWFQTECALAYQRLEKWGEALKKCHEVDRHFSEIIEDQFDFHAYCMRKMTLRSYVGLLRLEDVLRSHPFYFKAAKCAIQVYVRLFDKPLKDESAEAEINTENLLPSELKKLRNKQRKAKRKAEQESAQAAQAQTKKEQHNKSRQIEGDPEAPVLEDLIPEKLALVEDPLEQAIKFLKPLQMLVADNIETHLMAFEIYYRKNKLLLMLQSIKRAIRVDPENSMLHTCIIRFYEVMQGMFPNVDGAVKAVLEKEVQTVFRGKDSEKMNEEFLRTHTSLPALYAGARMMYQLNPKRREESLKLITDFTATDITLEGCARVLKSLQQGDFGSCPKHVEDFAAECRARFPFASVFKNDDVSSKQTIPEDKALLEEN